MTLTSQTLPTLYIPHGGGPCFFMERPGRDIWDGMEAYLRGIARNVGVRPKAILVISAHWENERPTVGTHPAPPLLFDYYGFPEHTYRLTYPAPGSPELARRVQALLDDTGMACDGDAERGLDHGVFVPFLLIYPEADIPVVQLSLRADLDPAAHLALGRALRPLRDEGVLIVGSGMSYHNLREIFKDHPQANQASVAFDDWLNDALSADTETRDKALIDWAAAPSARTCHPREEHLIPLMVAAGAAGDDRAVRTYNEAVLGKAISGFQFG